MQKCYIWKFERDIKFSLVMTADDALLVVRLFGSSCL